jgi:hypothetical protein
MTQESQTQQSARLELTPLERRVLGVLIEKGLTTPDQYPLTLNALVNGCNQKNNRDPITNYDEIQVDAALQTLIRKGVAANATGFGGRVERYNSQMGKMFELRSVEVGVIGELLLRGPQTEGELRIRASRMRPIADLDALEEILKKLRETQPPFVVRLSPSGQVRGVRYAHAFYPAGELAKIRASESEAPSSSIAPMQGDDDSGESVPLAQTHNSTNAELLRRIASLEDRVRKLEALTKPT